MQIEPNMRINPFRLAKMTVITFMLFAPIIVYVYMFGFTISNSHTRWAEMGSAMSGIYSPILAFLALLVISKQLKLQEAITTHEFDQSYLQNARSDIQYYIDQLERALDESDENGNTARQVLSTVFMYTNSTALQSQKVAEVAQSLHAMHPRILSIWSTINPILAGLSAPNNQLYNSNLSDARMKITIIVSFQIAVALDNYHWCLSKGKYDLKYLFSTDMPS